MSGPQIFLKQKQILVAGSVIILYVIHLGLILIGFLDVGVFQKEIEYNVLGAY